MTPLSEFIMAFVLAELVVQCDAATVFKYTGVPSFKYVYIYWEALIQVMHVVNVLNQYLQLALVSDLENM